MTDPMQDLVEDSLKRLLLSVAVAQDPPKFTKELRCSSLPYCPIRHFLNMDSFTNSYKMQFYTDIGTVLHSLMQYWLPKADTFLRKRIYGCWVCTNCGNEIGPCNNPVICTKCGIDALEYKEVPLKYKKLSGHVDFIYEWSTGQYVVVDFKSTSLLSKRIKYPHNWREQYPGSMKYLIQIKTYASLLREELGINVTSWCLVFIDRNTAIEKAEDFHTISGEWNEKKTNSLLKKLNRSNSNYMRVLKLNGRIENRNKFDSLADEMLDRIIENRPCFDSKSWKAWMQYGFYKKECELLEYCTKSDRSIRKEIEKRL